MSDVERVKEKADIVDVISTHVTLLPAGKNMKGNCPFHNEKTPSFFVSPERQTFYCFGCGVKGDVISFVEQYENLDFLGSLKMLAERYGVELTNQRDGKKDDGARIYDVLEKATVFFENEYKSHKEARDYVRDRGMSDESVAHWRIGFAPDSWRTLYEHLSRMSYTDEEIQRAGLIRRTEKGDRVIDLFRNRIMFPIRDTSGRVIAFSGRTLSKEDGVPKYVNSPETELFKKSRVLFGLYEGRQTIRKTGYSILVEGQMDVLACHGAGLKNAVASSGTAFTMEQALLLKRMSPKLIILFDSDKAGKQAALKTTHITLGAGIETKIALLPEGKDPADVVKEDPKILGQKLKEAQHAIEVWARIILQEETKPERRVVRALQEVGPLILKLESDSLRDHFTDTVARLLGVEKDAFANDVYRMKDKVSTERPLAPPEISSLDTEKDDGSKIVKILSYVIAAEKLQKNSIYSKEFEEIMAKLPEEEREDLREQAETEKAMFEVEKLYEGVSEKQLDPIVKDFLKNLHIEVLKKKYIYAQDDKEKFLISKEIDTLKNS